MVAGADYPPSDGGTRDVGHGTSRVWYSFGDYTPDGVVGLHPTFSWYYPSNG